MKTSTKGILLRLNPEIDASPHTEKDLSNQLAEGADLPELQPDNVLQSTMAKKSNFSAQLEACLANNIALKPLLNA